MNNGEHEFCRALLKEVMQDVRKVVEPNTISHAWGYNYKGERACEFHINSCKEVPDGFYWHGSGCCVWHAKAQGWQAYIERAKKGQTKKESKVNLCETCTADCTAAENPTAFRPRSQCTFYETKN